MALSGGDSTFWAGIMKNGHSNMEFVAALESRRDDLITWLENHGPECEIEQSHLDEGTEERTYWHFGYLVAIKDMLALLGNASTPRH